MSARTLTSTKAAAALGLSGSTVQMYARKGRIPFDTTPGGHRRFNVDEVRRALEFGVRRPSPPLLPLAIRVGSIWCWEPLTPHAREECRVTATRWTGEEWQVQTESVCRPSGRYWNGLDRFVEAAVLVRPGP